MTTNTPPGTYDLAIIGGGITGAGIARDAALRGLSCVLLEKGDFSSGTSSRTTRLVHGGLRYLEYGQLHLVLESLRERELLLRMAPHLIHPIPILLPVYRGDPRKRWKIRAGLALYDLLSLGKGTPHYAVLERRSALRRSPHLAPEELIAAGLFYDYQIALPERLVLENVLSARAHGAVCLNYHEVEQIGERMNRFEMTVRDTLDGTESLVCARVVVNASGPWADEVSRLYRPDLARKLYPTKGAHIVVDADPDHAVFSTSPRDQRLFFTLPLEGLTLVGTTDTPWSGDPALATATAEDVDYLLAGLNSLLPGRPFGREDVLWCYAGVRPLALRKGAEHPSQLSRQHVLHREGSGGRFLSIVGGKYTTFRRMAEETVDAVCGLLNHRVSGSTEHEPLFGGGMKDRVIFREQLCECTGRIPDLPRDTVEHLVSLYGRRCCEVMELSNDRPELRQRIASSYQDYRAQVVYAVREESARTLPDMVLRRLHMSISADRGWSAASKVAELMGEELGWDDTTRREQLEQLRHQLAAPRPACSL